MTGVQTCALPICPVGIQIFGGDVDVMREAAIIAESVNPNLIDINYGCPVKAVACKGAGASLLRDIPRMVKITEEIVKAVKLPVTVKTRLGWDDNTKNVHEVAERLQDIGIQALSIHGRTRVQMYKGYADWTMIGMIKDNPRITIPIFGNGDVQTPKQAKELREQYGVDGIMIGRASIGHPWIFNEIKHYMKTGELLPPPTVSDRVNVARKHLQKSIEWKGEKLGILEMRRHYANYFKAFPNFKEFRARFVTTNDAATLFDILEEVLERYEATEFAA